MTLMLALALVGSPFTFDEEHTISQIMHVHDMALSNQERNRIHQECKFALQKMHRCMNDAQREAAQITNIDVREATVGAIEGAICGFGGRTPYTVIIGGCLGAVARIGGDSYRHFVRSRDHLRDAEDYARIADDLQERLWRDE